MCIKVKNVIKKILFDMLTKYYQGCGFLGWDNKKNNCCGSTRSFTRSNAANMLSLY
jgi:hypothetical protein